MTEKLVFRIAMRLVYELTKSIDDLNELKELFAEGKFSDADINISVEPGTLRATRLLCQALGNMLGVMNALDLFAEETESFFPKFLLAVRAEKGEVYEHVIQLMHEQPDTEDLVVEDISSFQSLLADYVSFVKVTAEEIDPLMVQEVMVEFANHGKETKH